MQILANRKLVALAIGAGVLLALLLSTSSAQAGVPEGDVDCSKEINGDVSGVSVEPGEDVTFDVLCTALVIPVAAGTVVAGDELIIVDDLFANFVIDEATCDSGDNTGFDTSVDADIDAQEVTCTFVPDVNTTEFRVTVNGAFNGGPCGDYTNVALATYDEDSEEPEVDFFVACEDLAVSKTASSTTDTSGATVAAGGTLRYAVEVCNNPIGNALAEDVVITDTLPSGVTFQSSDSADVTANASGGTITATVNVLDAGDCATLFIDVLIGTDTPCGFVLTNSASVASTTGSTFDADTSDNSDSVSTTLVCVLGTTPVGENSGGDSGPVVGAGNSGLAGAAAGIEPWQLVILAMLVVPTVLAAGMAYRRLE